MSFHPIRNGDWPRVFPCNGSASRLPSFLLHLVRRFGATRHLPSDGCVYRLEMVLYEFQFVRKTSRVQEHSRFDLAVSNLQ